VGDRHLESLTTPEAPRERTLRLLHDDMGPLAAELKAIVPQEGPREEAGLAENLEAIAASQNQPAAGHEARQGVDDW
jgi:hypothetical protein